MNNEATPQCRLPARDPAEPKLLRYHIQGWIDDATGRRVPIRDFFSMAQPLDRNNLRGFMTEEARKLGAMMKDGGAFSVDRFFPLLPVPRPAPGDSRPLLSWEIYVYFICHDVRFGGSASAVFAWPEEPTGAVLSQMTAVLMADALASRGDGPSYVDVSDVDIRKATPSPLAPTIYF